MASSSQPAPAFVRLAGHPLRLQPRVVESVDVTRSSFDHPGRPRPVRVYVWEPVVRSVDGLTRLILLSHGTGASGRDMAWLAEPLTRAGFLVAAVDHHGNNWVDGYAAPGFVFAWERPADLRHALSLIEHDRDIDWVGAAGFSAGGYAAAALVGVRLDPHLIRLLVEGGMASEASLRAVTRPVEIRWADADVITPPEQTALRYLDLIDGAHGQSLGRHVQHHHLFPETSEGADARTRAATDAVAFLTQASGLDEPS